MEITEKLTAIFQEVFDDQTIALREEMTADDVDAWDSLSHVNLMIAIELAFDIEFKQNEIQGFDNVGELIKNIKEKVSAR
jgi:acyl carrier protein